MLFFLTFFGSPKNPDIYPKKYIDFPYIPNYSGDSGLEPHEILFKKGGVWDDSQGSYGCFQK